MAESCNPVQMGPLTDAVNASYEENRNPKQQLIGCAFMVSMGGLNPGKVYDELKCCKEAVEEECSFRWSKKRISGPPECKIFPPWNR